MRFSRFTPRLGWKSELAGGNGGIFNFQCFNCRANSKISDLQRSKAAEIAKLTALLRKSDMRIASLERSVEQKVKIEIFFTKLLTFINFRAGRTRS